MISDEIHCDLTRVHRSYVPAASLDAKYADKIISLYSVTKTFTIDKTAPGRVYSTVRVNKTEYEENKVKYYYVKIKIRRCTRCV